MSLTRSHVTRALHLTILLIVIAQLSTSTVMERPFPGDDPDPYYSLHVVVGCGGLAALALFWLWTHLRSRLETPLWRLVPWFSARGLAGLRHDVRTLWRAARAGRTPPLRLDAVASAIHGLGLCLATFLALSGAIWFYVLTGTPYAHYALAMHKLAGNAMWVYLIGHASMAVLHQMLGDEIFARMFWVRRRGRSFAVPAE